MLARVLTNLLENAARHGPKGTPITVSARLSAAGTIELAVTDHGPGVEPARRDQVFGLLARRDGAVGPARRNLSERPGSR